MKFLTKSLELFLQMIFFLKVLPHLVETMYLVLSMLKVRRFVSQYFSNFAREKFKPCYVFERITKSSTQSKEPMDVPSNNMLYGWV